MLFQGEGREVWKTIWDEGNLAKSVNLDTCDLINSLLLNSLASIVFNILLLFSVMHTEVRYKSYTCCPTPLCSNKEIE